MQFLKTVFWVLIAVLVVLFAVRNWTPVTLNLWTDIQAETKLPMLVFVGFVIGWLPTWLTRSTSMSLWTSTIPSWWVSCSSRRRMRSPSLSVTASSRLACTEPRCETLENN